MEFGVKIIENAEIMGISRRYRWIIDKVFLCSIVLQIEYR